MRIFRGKLYFYEAVSLHGTASEGQKGTEVERGESFQWLQ